MIPWCSVGISKITSDSTGSFIAVSVVEIMRDGPADLGGALQPDNVVLLYACQEEYPGMIHTTFLK